MSGFKTPGPELTYQKAVSKGQKLLAMMRADDASAGQMFHPPRSTASSDLTGLDAWDSGYDTRLLTDCNDPIETYENVLESLESNARSWDDDFGDNLEPYWVHRYETVQKDGNVCPATGAKFANVVNNKAGMLIAFNNFGPGYMAARKIADMGLDPARAPPLPKLKNWSDVAFLQWMSCAASDSDLRFVLRANIHNDDTLAIMSHLIGEDSGTKLLIGSPLSDESRQARPHWPGMVFDMESEAAQALLGTPNGSGVGWLLAQRKRELGHKVVGKVTLFFSEFDHEDGDVEDQPNLLFHIEDVNE
jgi:hypothetical protein